MPQKDPKIQKLDDLSLKLLSEGQGPCNECICNLIVPPKEPVTLRNKLRNCYDSMQMRKDSTGKLLFRTKNPNLVFEEEGPKKEKKAPKSAKAPRGGKPPKGGKPSKGGKAGGAK